MGCEFLNKNAKIIKLDNITEMRVTELSLAEGISLKRELSDILSDYARQIAVVTKTAYVFQKCKTEKEAKDLIIKEKDIVDSLKDLYGDKDIDYLMDSLMSDYDDYLTKCKILQMSKTTNFYQNGEKMPNDFDFADLPQRLVDWWEMAYNQLNEISEFEEKNL